MAQQKSKLPSNSGLSRELIAYHQKNEDQLSSLQTTVADGAVTIDGATGDFTLGYGLSRASQALGAGLSSTFTASLGADIALNNTANYFDGPSVAQGSTGTWFVIGTATVTDTASAANHSAKLWDGTTVIASCSFTSLNTGRNIAVLSGVITSPAGDLRISVRDLTSTNGLILFNQSGNSKDSTITAVRIA